MSDLWTPEKSRLTEVESPSTSVELPSTELAPILIIADGRIRIDTVNNVAVAEDKPLKDLESIPFKVLATLAEKPDSLVRHSELSQKVWDYDDYYTSSAAPSTAICSLRKSLGKELGDSKLGAIRTHNGLGYYAISTMGTGRPLRQRDEKLSYWIADNRIELDVLNNLVVSDGEEIDSFTPTLFRLFAQLAKKPNRVMSHRELGIAEWGYYGHDIQSRLAVAISMARKSLGSELGNKKTGAIRSRRGFGYYAVRSLTNSSSLSL